jgi:hypothetical protein
VEEGKTNKKDTHKHSYQYSLLRRTCCRKIGAGASGCKESSEHKLLADGWTRCSKCDTVYNNRHQFRTGTGNLTMYERQMANKQCSFHRGRMEHRGGKLWLYSCCNGQAGLCNLPGLWVEG